MKKIGYTTGVFDMFHIGHLNLLKRAKLECDYLIVGVTTDELSAQAKGKKPIIPLVERMEIVENIKFVDEVIPQVNYDKYEAWRNIGFDKMFVGDDWKGSNKWNELEKEFNSLGVEIVYFPYSKNTSSTVLRKKLKIIHENEY
ncbi:adenylyltransferase/cytidyltransferase family protein [Photobacterium damselae]